MKIVHIDNNKLAREKVLEDMGKRFVESFRRNARTQVARILSQQAEATASRSSEVQSKIPERKTSKDIALDLVVGDVVQLKSGGPKMTLECAMNDGTWEAHWFAGSAMKKGCFHPNTIKKIAEN